MQLTPKQLAEKNVSLIKNSPALQRDGYLIRRKKGGVKCAHIWRHGDTACRMALTGGLNLRGYVVAHMTDLPICENCERVEMQALDARNEEAGEPTLNQEYLRIMGRVIGDKP